jgi:SAM-dependent methyltransferase
MPSRPSEPPGLFGSARAWWREHSARQGFLSTTRDLVGVLWNFARDSTPARRKQRYGDVEYDWDHRVDTTSATVGWRDRLLGMFLSPYQATEPALFHEMLCDLDIDLRQYIFIDLGSGKGRTLLMAADYPFRRIVGVELLPELNRVAQENIDKYKSDSQKCCAVESLCADARDFVFPPGPLVLYLFNPLPESGLVQVMDNLERSLRENPRPIYVLYHNPLLEHVLARGAFRRAGGTHQYSKYVAPPN